MEPYYKIFVWREREKKNPDHDIFQQIRNGHPPIAQQKCCPLQKWQLAKMLPSPKWHLASYSGTFFLPFFLSFFLSFFLTPTSST